MPTLLVINAPLANVVMQDDHNKDFATLLSEVLDATESFCSDDGDLETALRIAEEDNVCTQQPNPPLQPTSKRHIEGLTAIPQDACDSSDKLEDPFHLSGNSAFSERAIGGTPTFHNASAPSGTVEDGVAQVYRRESKSTTNTFFGARRLSSSQLDANTRGTIAGNGGETGTFAHMSTSGIASTLFGKASIAESLVGGVVRMKDAITSDVARLASSVGGSVQSANNDVGCMLAKPLGQNHPPVGQVDRSRAHHAPSTTTTTTCIHATEHSAKSSQRFAETSRDNVDPVPLAASGYPFVGPLVNSLTLAALGDCLRREQNTGRVPTCFALGQGRIQFAIGTLAGTVFLFNDEQEIVQVLSVPDPDMCTSLALSNVTHSTDLPIVVAGHETGMHFVHAFGIAFHIWFHTYYHGGGTHGVGEVRREKGLPSGLRCKD